MRVLFVGLGGVGQRHLRNLKKLLPDVQIYALRYRKRQIVLDDKLNIVQGKNLDEEYNIINIENFEQAIEEEIGVVFICNPTSMHAEILEKAILAEMFVFVEKPIAQSMLFLNRMDDLLNRNCRKIFVGYQNRFHPCVKKCREFLKERKIGRILCVDVKIGESVKLWHRYEDYRNMYACKKELGGGVVVTQIHELDYLYLMFGMPVEVYAVGGKLSDLDIDVDDVVSILMKYDIDGHLIPITVREDYIQNPPCRSCKIVGTQGTISFDLLDNRIQVFSDNGDIDYDAKFVFERNDMFYDEMVAFIDCIRTGNNPISYDEGKRSLIIADAINESLKTDRVVVL